MLWSGEHNLPDTTVVDPPPNVQKITSTACKLVIRSDGKKQALWMPLTS